MTGLSRRGVIGLGAAGFATFRIGRAKAADPLKFGASLSLTGRFSDSAKYVQEGYALWAEQVNAKGGIKGRPVSVVTYDDESNPDTGRILAERLIDRDGVFAILGPYSSPITDAMATACERGQVPMVGTIASDSSIWARRKLRWSFQGFTSSDYDHEGFLKVVKAKAGDLKKLAIIFEEAPFSIGAKDWALPVAKEMGLTVETYGYTPGSQDFRSIIERMVAAGTEMVSMGGYYQPSIALTRQMMERGLNPAGYHFIQAADGVTKDALGNNTEGIFGRSSWEATIDTPANKDFVAAYKAKFQPRPLLPFGRRLRGWPDLPPGHRPEGRRSGSGPRDAGHGQDRDGARDVPLQRAWAAGRLPLRLHPMAGRPIADRRRRGRAQRAQGDLAQAEMELIAAH